MGKRVYKGKDLGLKVGDRVYLDGGYRNENAIVNVSRITPSGQVVVQYQNGKELSVRFYPDGSQVGSSYSYRSRLLVLTPKVERGFRHEQVVRKLESALNKWNWRRASIEDIQAVREIIGPYLRRE